MHYRSVKVRMNPIKGSIIALALAVSGPLSNFWAQQTGAELLNNTCVTKHQAKRIALARVKSGTIKCTKLEKENGMLIWSVDVTRPGKKNLRNVWVDATTGKITAVEAETPIAEEKEVAERKVKMAFTS